MEKVFGNWMRYHTYLQLLTGESFIAFQKKGTVCIVFYQESHYSEKKPFTTTDTTANYILSVIVVDTVTWQGGLGIQEAEHSHYRDFI